VKLLVRIPRRAAGWENLRRRTPRAETVRMTRVPEQVECAGSESSRRSWGAPGRHVEPGPPDGVRMMGRLRVYELVVANSAELDACASDAGAWRLIRSVL
jgi:hypothetical protein